MPAAAAPLRTSVTFPGAAPQDTPHVRRHLARGTGQETLTSRSSFRPATARSPPGSSHKKHASQGGNRSEGVAVRQRGGSVWERQPASPGMGPEAKEGGAS